jgi:DNA-binding response OmpR family regulator
MPLEHPRKGLPLPDLRVLIVDDDPVSTRLIVEVLRRGGVGRIQTATTAHEALRTLDAVRPHVIFVDWQMPRMDGVTMTRIVRAAALQPDPLIPDPAVPIVMLTGRGREVDVERARLAGVSEFVLKPFSPEVLLARLEAVMSRSREFVVAERYVGPDRRRRRPQPGPRRRSADAALASPVATGEREATLHTIQVELDAMRQLRSQPSGGEREAARLCYRSMQHNIERARAIRDRAIEQASNSLVRYVDAVGGPEKADPRIIEVHMDALGRLLVLGDGSRAAALVNERLKTAVDKKIGRTISPGEPR